MSPFVVAIEAQASQIRRSNVALQKSKVAAPRIFRENTKRKAIVDSYSRNRVGEVAREFNVRR
jgi:hypothetical protein